MCPHSNIPATEICLCMLVLRARALRMRPIDVLEITCELYDVVCGHFVNTNVGTFLTLSKDFIPKV